MLLMPIAYCLLPIAYCLFGEGGARTVGATTAALRPGAVCRGPWGGGRLHLEGYRSCRGAWGRPRGLGGMALGNGGLPNVIKDESSKY